MPDDDAAVGGDELSVDVEADGDVLPAAGDDDPDVEFAAVGEALVDDGGVGAAEAL